MKSGIKKNYVGIIKPLLDRIVALALIILCSPLFILTAILIAIFNPGSVLFHQKRVGKKEVIFSLHKFRTMSGDKSSGKEKFPGLGRVLRKLSLDELPQLFNVLKGEMSLVGPRPLLVEYLEYYNEEESSRHAVLPGITGWAQVNGRNRSGWKTRMEQDRYYVQHISFLLDCKILLLTFTQLFRFSQADFTDHDQETFIDYAKKR